MKRIASIGQIGGIAATLAALGALYASALIAGLALFTLLFKSGALHASGVMFFRGLALAAVTFAILFPGLGLLLKAIGSHRLGARDAFSASILSLSLNICFLVVAPVTVDRSVSIFILGEMAANPQTAYTPDDMSRLFVKVYTGEDKQIERRLSEQTSIGNIVESGGRFQVSARGRGFIEICKIVSWLFDGDPRFVSPHNNPPAAP